MEVISNLPIPPSFYLDSFRILTNPGPKLLKKKAEWDTFLSANHAVMVDDGEYDGNEWIQMDDFKLSLKSAFSLYSSTTSDDTTIDCRNIHPSDTESFNDHLFQGYTSDEEETFLDFRDGTNLTLLMIDETDKVILSHDEYADIDPLPFINEIIEDVPRNAVTNTTINTFDTGDNSMYDATKTESVIDNVMGSLFPEKSDFTSASDITDMILDDTFVNSDKSDTFEVNETTSNSIGGDSQVIDIPSLSVVDKISSYTSDTLNHVQPREDLPTPRLISQTFHAVQSPLAVIKTENLKEELVVNVRNFVDELNRSDALEERDETEDIGESFGPVGYIMHCLSNLPFSALASSDDYYLIEHHSTPSSSLSDDADTVGIIEYVMSSMSLILLIRFILVLLIGRRSLARLHQNHYY